MTDAVNINEFSVYAELAVAITVDMGNAVIPKLEDFNMRSPRANDLND